MLALHHIARPQGTPAYAAPELLSRGRLTRASDVWSFGVLLLELMHGEGIVAIRQRAGAGADSPDSSMGAEVSVAGGPRPAWMAPPPGCPPRLCALLDSCLAVDDAARPAFTTVSARRQPCGHGLVPGRRSTACAT